MSRESRPAKFQPAYQISDGRIRIGSAGPESFDLADATKSFETPFYFYNLDHVAARAAFLKNALVKGAGLPASIHYAIKANANPGILKTLKTQGIGIDAVSGGEVECARKNGVDASDILFSGVAKSVRELRAALSLGIKQINVESLGELERIERLALEMNPSTPVSIGLRLNPNVSPETHPYITTGLKENKFGLEEDAIFEAANFLKKTKAPLRFRGLSLHIGSQLLELSALDEALELSLGVQRRLLETMGAAAAPDRFDAGGGIGINYDSIDESAECDVIQDYANLLKKHLAPEISAGRVRELLVEPGRWLVARSGLLVSEVQYVKTTQHKSFLIVDGGMNLLIRPALYEAEHRIAPLANDGGTDETAVRTPSTGLVDVVGPICESADFLGRNRELPPMKPGDRLAVFDAGAYGRTMASNYNQHGWPAEYVYQNGSVTRVDSV